MAAVAIVARPRLWLAGALLGITLFCGHEPAPRAPVLRPPPAAVAIEGVPAPAVVIQLQPKSDLARLDRAMVLEPPETGDHLNIGVAPLAAWIEHLLWSLL